MDPALFLANKVTLQIRCLLTPQATVSDVVVTPGVAKQVEDGVWSQSNWKVKFVGVRPGDPRSCM